MPQPPNVIIVLTDDQGYGDLSCHGNPVIRTPNMDRLHAESVRLTDFHAAPMCTPARGQLMTGMDAMANAATAVCQGRSMMREGLPTMAEVFAAAGYRTGLFGKWHLGDSYPHRPEDRGFEETVHHGAWGITSIADFWGNSYWDDTYHHNGVYEPYRGYCTDVWFREAMEWIDACRVRGEPFFAYIPTNVPHAPLRVDEQYAAPYRGEHEGKPIPAEFYGMIANADENLGKLEAYLGETGLRDNTILIFMTDNGCANQQAVEIHNAGMRGRKTQNWEGGHRVPCFIRWPAGRLGPPRDIDALTEMQDLLPTLAEFCGMPIPAPERLDGMSLAGLLRGEQSELSDRMLVVQYGAACAPWENVAVMWRKWRLLDGDRLYDLQTDRHQDHDIAQQHADVVDAMRAHYQSWRIRVEPLFNETRWIRLGSIRCNPLTLYSSDWDGDYADNPHNLLQGTAVGQWRVIFERAGDYEITLRRWPAESHLPLAAPVSDEHPDSARPIARARLRIGDFDQTIDTPPGSEQATFRVHLESGRTGLETWFLDTAGQVMCSAFHTTVQRQ